MLYLHDIFWFCEYLMYVLTFWSITDQDEDEYSFDDDDSFDSDSDFFDVSVGS